MKHYQLLTAQMTRTDTLTESMKSLFSWMVELVTYVTNNTKTLPRKKQRNNANSLQKLILLGYTRMENSLDASSITLPNCLHTCIAFQRIHNIINNPWGVSHLTYQQTFQVYGRSGVSDHVLQLLQPGFHPPLGAQRHDCGRAASKLTRKMWRGFPNCFEFTWEPSLFLANGRRP